MAEEKEAGGDQQEGGASTVEDRLGKLEKALTDAAKRADDEAKRAAGLDKKVSELLSEKKQLQESTLSKDKLLEIREAELKEAQSKADADNAQERLELQKLRIELDRRDVVSKIDGFPARFVPWVPGTSRDEIEANAREFMKSWSTDKAKLENARKVTGAPRSGGGKQVNVMGSDDVKLMTPKQQKDWAETEMRRDPENYKKVFAELQGLSEE